MSEAQFQIVDIGRLTESPLNPRRHYDPEKIKELAESMMGGVGVIEPLVVRPSKNEHLEIIAGSRRHRAAKIAGLAEIPVIVRDLDDATALEIMVIENDQREDTNALEQAEGYHRLMKTAGYTVERIAERIGQSPKWVYDRIKLLQLVPEAKKLILSDKISAGHAILLARLKPEEQKRAIDFDNRDVWSYEKALFAPDDEPEEEPFKICSVRELEAWIDQHVRFHKNVTAVDSMLFPETKKELLKAFEKKEKVVQITWNYSTPPDAKEGNEERIFHISSWKHADGSSKEAKTCEKSVTGVIVVGPERGKAFRVCVNKECMVHWAKENKERERRARSAGGQSAIEKKYQEEEASRRAEQKRQESRRQVWNKASSAIIQACAEKLKTAKIGVYSEIIQRGDLRLLKDSVSLLGKPKTIEDWLRLVCLTLLMEECYEWDAARSFIPCARRLGIDVAMILKAHAPKQEKPKESVQTTAKEEDGKGEKKALFTERD